MKLLWYDSEHQLLGMATAVTSTLVKVPSGTRYVRVVADPAPSPLAVKHKSATRPPAGET